MGVFLLMTLFLVRVGGRMYTQWTAWEQRIKHANVTGDLDLLQTRAEPEFAMYMELRREFIRRDQHSVKALTHKPLDLRFDFAEYMGIALGELLAEIVEVSCRSVQSVG